MPSRGYRQSKHSVESCMKFVRAPDLLDKAAYFQQDMAEMSRLSHPVRLVNWCGTRGWENYPALSAKVGSIW